MRTTPAVVPAVAAAMLFAAAPARAEERDPVVAVAIGAATMVVGFAVGGTIIGTTAHANPANDVPGDNTKNIAGWFAIEGGFVLAPLASHAAVGEWGRGAVFAAVPAATTVATIPVFTSVPDAVDHGSLPVQRWMWGFFCGGMAAAAVGIVDSAFAPGRSVRIAPMLGTGTAGVIVGGAL
jgi:hypothetical protein